MPKRIKHSHRKWRTLAAKVLAQAKRDGQPCWLCGRPIDWDADPRTSWSPSVDHIEPANLGGDMLPPIHALRPAHFGCNASRQDGTVPTPLIDQRRRGTPRLFTSRDW